ncbi:Clathrin heavy chain, partial [Paramarasmius palmivorus]
LNEASSHATTLPPDWLHQLLLTLDQGATMALLARDASGCTCARIIQVVVQDRPPRNSDITGSRVLDLRCSESAANPDPSPISTINLGSIVNLSTDPEVHFKYIQAATRTGQIREVERICRESNYYNPEKVKNFLKEARLSDQLPLIIVCDRFDFVHDLVLYLYQNNLINFIEVYVQRVNSVRTPQVVGGLLDVDCDESTIKSLLASVPGNFPIDELAEEVEQRNRLKLILPWLEACVQAGSQDTAIYNAIAKIYIDSNNPESFLKENNLYEPLVVGKLCAARNPSLAFIAYAKGFCDEELITLTKENSMFKQQARYLVKRRQPELRARVLVPDNMYRRQLIDQLVAPALVECTDTDNVSVTIKALLTTNLLIEPSPFSDNKNLQNLLLLTAIPADKGKVEGYINKLQNYDTEGALTIHKKYEQHAEAINVLVEHIVSIDSGLDYANEVNRRCGVAKAQLDGLRIKDTIDSYIKAEGSFSFTEVIAISSRAGKYNDLENNLYDPLVVGKLCAARNPSLAFIAYAKGFCDEESIAMTKGNSMFQASYLLVANALVECTDTDAIFVTVKAFLTADLIELIELLEKIVIEPSPFSDKENLQNLILLAAIRADRRKAAYSYPFCH